MNDLTVLLTTGNKIKETSAKKFRDYLIKVTGNKYPIISVSQKPIDFGRNICVGDIGYSKYNGYKQILIGVREVETKYVACVDDDTLYSPDHFEYRPEEGVFSYETNYWFAQGNKDFYWRVADINKRGGMWGCISETKALLDNLTKRFEYYPVNPWTNNIPTPPGFVWGEPGICDQSFGIVNKMIKFFSKNPCVIFVHPESMGYRQLSRFHRRYGNPAPENMVDTLEQFGNIKEVWKKYWE